MFRNRLFQMVFDEIVNENDVDLNIFNWIIRNNKLKDLVKLWIFDFA